jgi:hypothetical protein
MTGEVYPSAVPLMLATIVAGTFAFHYARPLTPAQLAWYGRFEVLVTHDPLPRAQVDALHKSGTKVLLYEWSIAFYDTLAASWQRSLIHTPAVLNAQPLRGGVGSETADAWYYDPVSHRDTRAKAIARKLRTIGYDGVFLDTTTAVNVHPAALAEFKRRHPERDYDAEYARFLATLRRELKGKLIFTNQGYRDPEHYLPYADWDLSESLITWPIGDRYEARPWNDPADPWNSIRFLFDNVIAPAHARYPHVRFAHLNYGDTTFAPLAVATAKLFGGAAYIAGDEQSELYFLDLGKPLGPRVDRGNASYRLFQHGVAAVNASREPLAIPGTKRIVPPGASLVEKR